MFFLNDDDDLMRAALLDNVSHRNLRLQTRLDAAWGDAASAVPTVPAEFKQVEAHFPIVFQQSTDAGGFQPVALLGLLESRSSFLGLREGGVWEAGPFALGAWSANPCWWAETVKAGLCMSTWTARDPELRARASHLFLPNGGQSPLCWSGAFRCLQALA